MKQPSVPVSSTVRVQTGYEPRDSSPVLRTCLFSNSIEGQQLCPEKGGEMGDTMDLATLARDSALASGDTSDPEHQQVALCVNLA